MAKAICFDHLLLIVGHNFGHDHHSRNHYVYRETRPKLTSPYKRDGFDMVRICRVTSDLRFIILLPCKIYILKSSFFVFQDEWRQLV